jgi:hypothetical protein
MYKQRFIDILLKRVSFSELKAQEWDKVLRILRQTDLVSTFGYVSGAHANEKILPSYLHRHVSAAKVFSDAQTRQVFTASSLISNAANDIGIDLLFLKGAAYSLGQTANSRGRLFSDIDILVKPEALAPLENYLKSNGWACKELNDYDNKYYREWSHELPPFTHLATGVSLDIHHTLLPPVSGYKIDLNDLWSSKVTLASGFSIPNHAYLILHSAIHLLLNEDVEKGFRDLLDIHLLLGEVLSNSSIEELKKVFCRSGFEFEFSLLIALLDECFGSNHFIQQKPDSSKLNFWKRTYYKSIFPVIPELNEGSHGAARLLVYINGHLNKMPLGLFLKHISYKASRSLTKKLFGEFVFK